MLKACCDCIAAGTREENDVYGTQLNGNNLRAPLWPEMENQTDTPFLLPRSLNIGDKINISGKLFDDFQWFSIGLVRERPEDIIAQIEFDLPSSSSENEGTILLKTLKNGNLENINSTEKLGITPRGIIRGHDAFPKFTITIVITNNSVDFKIGTSDLDFINVDYSEINSARYLIVKGDIKKINGLEFLFA